MMDFSSMMKLKGAWDTFSANHPKFVPFMRAITTDGIQDGTMIEMKVTSAEGKEYNTNLRITESDLALFQEMKTMMNKGR